MAKVYIVVEGWRWEGELNYVEYESGEEILGVFTSEDLAEKYIREFNFTKLYRNERMPQYYQIVSDQFLNAGIHLDRFIDLVCENRNSIYYKISMIEHEVIEELD